MYSAFLLASLLVAIGFISINIRLSLFQTNSWQHMDHRSLREEKSKKHSKLISDEEQRSSPTTSEKRKSIAYDVMATEVPLNSLSTKPGQSHVIDSARDTMDDAPLVVTSESAAERHERFPKHPTLDSMSSSTRSFTTIAAQEATREIAPIILVGNTTTYSTLDVITSQTIMNKTSRTNAVTTIATKTRAHDMNTISNFFAKDTRLLLNVPFYVYDNVGLPDELTYNGTKFDPAKADGFQGRAVGHIYKHTDDVLLARAALEHPMRTMNPEEAKLFFVAAPLNVMSMCQKGSIPLCYKEHCGLGLLDHIDRTLANSPWYQRHDGKDHIIVTSHYKYKNMQRKGRWPNIMNANRIVFESTTAHDGKERFSFPSYYVGHGCTVVEETQKTLDFAMIGSLKPSNHHRRLLCDILQEEGSPYKSMCTMGVSHCPSLGEAKFGFHVRGDTWGANRLMDTILSDTVPIFTNVAQYKQLPKWIDWQQLSYFISINNTTDFRKSLDSVLEDTETYQVKLDALHRNRDLFNYDTLIPFDTYMYGFLVKVWPELGGSNTSPIPHFSALKLPISNSFNTILPAKDSTYKII